MFVRDMSTRGEGATGREQGEASSSVRPLNGGDGRGENKGNLCLFTYFLTEYFRTHYAFVLDTSHKEEYPAYSMSVSMNDEYGVSICIVVASAR